MNAALPALQKFEVLYGIGDVNLLPIEPRFVHRFAEQLAGRPNERMAFAVFFITGLFAHHNNVGVLRPFAEDYLCCVPVEIAAPAFRRGFS